MACDDPKMKDRALRNGLTEIYEGDQKTLIGAFENDGRITFSTDGNSGLVVAGGPIQLWKPDVYECAAGHRANGYIAGEAGSFCMRCYHEWLVDNFRTTKVEEP